MKRGHNLRPRRRLAEREHDPLPSQMAFLRIISRRRPLMHGGHDERTGDGGAFGSVGRQGPWMWRRLIKRGQWNGSWKRVQWIGGELVEAGASPRE